MPIQRIAFKDWLPDQPSILDAVSEANNVIPLAVGYGPFKSAVNYSGNASENLTNVYATKVDNDVSVFAGGLTKLYKLDSSDLTLDDVSKSGGYTGVTRWKFAQFGDTVIAANNVNKLQAWTLGSSTLFADLAAAAPVAKYVAVVRDFVVAANTVSNPNRVYWSDLNDETDWTSGAASQSDTQDIADGGDVMGITGGEFGLVFTERSVVRMSYVGSPFFFQFDTIGRGIGCITPNSLAQYASVTFFLSDDGFYKCDGQTITPIGAEKVDKFFFSDVNLNKLHEMSAAVDPLKKLVIWNYTDGFAQKKQLIYNITLGKWSYAETTANYINIVNAVVSDINTRCI